MKCKFNTGKKKKTPKIKVSRTAGTVALQDSHEKKGPRKNHRLKCVQ